VDVVFSTTRVVGGRGEIGRVGGVRGGFEEALQEGAAPAAAGSGAVALGKLAEAAGLFETDKVFDFAPRDVEAEAKFFVGLHEFPRRRSTTKTRRHEEGITQRRKGAKKED
jgi:hypothetical protein